jgi:alginate O-acetyltransferase complex protein AlgI
MFFDTPVYFLFLALVLLSYWRLGRRAQNVLLLVASYFFYGWWDWRFLGLIWVSTLVDFFCARVVANSREPAVRKGLLALSVALNLGFLGFFKYYDFFAGSLHSALLTLGWDVPVPLLNVLLPPGISFYTFQALAYIVDVYFSKMEPAESLLDYALFISLFPHLIAGPIQRPSHLLPQVQAPRTADAAKMFDGCMLIVTGLLRKCVVADNCALLANAAFNGNMGEPNIAVVLLGTYAFAFQIYGDFSGYSDIARGSAQLLGFHFMVNFRQPYLATSLQDFWRRWHISLSTWLRDYLYIPLGGNRNSEGQTYRNLLLTMLIGGFWHGANWTFMIWGAIHGLGLSMERWMGRIRRGDEQPRGLRRLVARMVTFHLVCLAWIFFRAESLGSALHFLSGLGRWQWRSEYSTAAMVLVMFCLPVVVLDLWLERTGEEYAGETHWAYPMRLAYALGVMVILTFFTANNANAFIYFQF